MGNHNLSTDVGEDKSKSTNGDLTNPETIDRKLNNVELEEEVKSYTMEEEWAIVGKTCDHCLFITFLVTFIIATIAIYVDAKYVH